MRRINKILFLCTGNYYRSRFAEEYFNYHAEKQALSWWADSKGISRNFEGNGNVGPMASQTLTALEGLSIQPKGRFRMPEYVHDFHFDEFDRVIAVSHSEHKPMMEEIWGDFSQWGVEFFDVEDLHIEGNETALPRLRQHIDHLLKGLL